MAPFPKWAAQRLFRLVRSGVGLVSTLATVALFVTPAFASWLSRWWALLPITAYLVYALLHDEYERLKQPCLTAQVLPPKEEGKLGSYSHLEPGSVTVATCRSTKLSGSYPTISGRS
jgi:hypothetical protein